MNLFGKSDNPSIIRGGNAAPSIAGLVSLVLMLLMAPNLLGAQNTLIHAGRLVDVAQGTVRTNVDILIENNRISAVGRDLKPGGEVVEIDLSDHTVLPGLIDSHTHICLTPDYGTRSPVLYKTNTFRTLEGLSGAREALMAGFTTLRDVDNEGADMADIAVRDAVRAGLVEGPRLFVSGWAISITAGHMNLTGLRPAVDRQVEQLAIMADSQDEMVAAIRDQVKTGVDFIKIYATGTMRHIDRATFEPLSQLSADDVRLMVTEAARWRLDVAAHAYGGQGAYNAVAGGVRSIEHGMFLDNRTLDLMVKKGTFWCPTMTVYVPAKDADPERAAFSNQVVERHRDTFKRALRKGVKITFGTDIGSMPHGAGWLELVRMADYGMAPMDIIRSATLRGAELLRLEDEIGQIAPGFLADIIAVQGEPDKDISVLEQVTFVMVDGKVVKREL